ncbi:hypothetical protein [Microbispora bryophytorum]|uniref:Uncharacterized protein n=1 Tax=Microbispora bryophytorum TaxID=1460882 RepID=A0A8H9H377_9ACTN|nr:hypothetical protein [Microbispora bryophytorum]MBD3138380.1 hypothetical protein [Microbispora bryophytorum]TQS04201.1 hypothetical protein FLX07_21300 [Microbispora bryophytorum]GGO24663.1 hypothetical protein GCM10011574_55300 [Microbispora bryophytorum]
MSRHCADVFRTDLVSAVRRLAVAALVVSLAGLAVPESADAASAPLRRKPQAAAADAKAPAHAKAKARPRPGPRGYQVARGGRTSARQYKSGRGRNIQNLNGVYTPSLLSGPQSTSVTSAGKISSQGAYCAPGGGSCDVSQNMR